MQGISTSYSGPNGMGTATVSSPKDMAQEMRTADAQIRAEAQRAIATAGREGGTVTAQYSFSIAPDGTSYVSGVTISTARLENLNGETVPNNLSATPNAPASLADIMRPSLPLQPSEFNEAFAQNIDQSLAEAGFQNRLQIADAGVRMHEAQHFRVAGGLAAGVPTYEYMEGPDGKLYAVAGAVQVQSSATADPEKAAQDAATFARAATAPGDVSAQDMSAARGAFASAAETYQNAMQARSVPIGNGAETGPAPVDMIA